MAFSRSLALRVFLCLGLLAGRAAPAAADADRAPLEAAIVYNILLYVQWPAEDSLAADAPFTLCMDPASAVFSAARQLEGRPLRRMKLTVQPVEAGLGRCQALFLDSSAMARVAAAVASKEGVLIVAGSRYSDDANASMVQLFETEGRLGFDVYQKRATQRNLTVSSRLLRLARKVIG